MGEDFTEVAALADQAVRGVLVSEEEEMEAGNGGEEEQGEMKTEMT